MKLSYSKIRTFMTCEQMYKWSYVDNLVPLSTPRALSFGKMGHRFLEEYYKHHSFNVPFSQSHMLELMNTFRKEADDSCQNANQIQNMEMDLSALMGMITAYQDIYKFADTEWEILAVELPVQTKVEYRGREVDLVGIIDLVVKDKNGNIWVVDHKFLRTISDELVRMLPLDFQMLCYHFLLNEWLQAHKIEGRLKGAIYNVIKKSGKRLKKKQTTKEYQMELAGDYLKEPDKYFHREPVLVFPESYRMFEKILNRHIVVIPNALMGNKFCPNTTSCTNFGQCSYLDLCLKGGAAHHLYKKKEKPDKEFEVI